MDVSADVRRSRWQALATDHGVCRLPGTTIEPENALRGTWKLMCERGWLEIGITLAPTMPPKVQSINIAPVLPPDAQMTTTIETIGKLLVAWDTDTMKSIAAPSLDVERTRRHFAAAAAWGTCRIGETLSGNGIRSSTVRLVCDKGPMAARVFLDANTRKLVGIDLVPLREQKCVP